MSQKTAKKPGGQTDSASDELSHLDSAFPGLKRLRIRVIPTVNFQDDINIMREVATSTILVRSFLYGPEKSISLLYVNWLGEPDPKRLEDISFIERMVPLAGQADEEDGEKQDIAASKSAQKESPYYLMFIKHPQDLETLLGEILPDLKCFFDFPWKFTLEWTELYLVGTQTSIRDAVSLLDGFKVKYEIMSLTNFHIGRDELLSSLTPLQYQHLRQAWEKGVYEIPRRTDIRTMAKESEISHTTLNRHLKKGIKKVLDRLFE